MNRKQALDFTKSIDQILDEQRPGTGSSGYRGIRSREYERYEAYERLDGEYFHLGVFPTLDEARVVLDQFRRQYIETVREQEGVTGGPYTREQASKLLQLAEVKMPGILVMWEKALREHGLWPEAT